MFNCTRLKFLGSGHTKQASIHMQFPLAAVWYTLNSTPGCPTECFETLLFKRMAVRSVVPFQ